MIDHQCPDSVGVPKFDKMFASIAASGMLSVTELKTAATFQQIAFESLSAFGTVGLSQGLSGPGSTLTAWGKLVLTSLMFIGRLGPITLVLSVAQLKERAVYKYPEDRVLVG